MLYSSVTLLADALLVWVFSANHRAISYPRAFTHGIALNDSVCDSGRLPPTALSPSPRCCAAQPHHHHQRHPFFYWEGSSTANHTVGWQNSMILCKRGNTQRCAVIGWKSRICVWAQPKPAGYEICSASHRTVSPPVHQNTKFCKNKNDRVGGTRYPPRHSSPTTHHPIVFGIISKSSTPSSHNTTRVGCYKGV